VGQAPKVVAFGDSFLLPVILAFDAGTVVVKPEIGHHIEAWE